MKRIFVVKHRFKATIRGNPDGNRIFKPKESVWWDPEDLSDPVVFEVDRVQFEADRAEFIKSIEPKPFPS
jgi:hypothetical protein